MATPEPFNMFAAPPSLDSLADLMRAHRESRKRPVAREKVQEFVNIFTPLRGVMTRFVEQPDEDILAFKNLLPEWRQFAIEFSGSDPCYAGPNGETIHMPSSKTEQLRLVSRGERPGDGKENTPEHRIVDEMGEGLVGMGGAMIQAGFTHTELAALMATSGWFHIYREACNFLGLPVPEYPME